MNDVFDQFRKGEQKDVPEASHTTENHKYVVIESPRSARAVFEQKTEDSVDSDGVKRSYTHVVVATACCGQLCSYDSDTRHKPPGGRCPSCRQFLCSKHVEDELSCSICFKRLCRACARQSKSVTFCKECFGECIGKKHKEEVLECIEKKKREAQD